MPSKVVHSIIPYWRVFGRVAVVMALSGSILAGAFIDRLAAGRRWLPRLAAVAIAVIALAEIAQRPPRPAGDLGRPDRLADILRDSQGGVAEYPLFGFDNYQLGPYLIRQLRHGRPLLNGSIEGTTAADLAWAAKTANAPEAQEALTLAGVLTAVVHPGSPQPNATGFRRSTRLPDGTSVYAVAGVTNAVVASLRGAYAEETGPDGSPFQWLAPRAAVRVIAEGHGAATLTFDAVESGDSSHRTIRHIAPGDLDGADACSGFASASPTTERQRFQSGLSLPRAICLGETPESPESASTTSGQSRAAGKVAEPMRLLWVMPRFGGTTVGGAERLVGELAARGVPDEWRSEVATTCATDHVTWTNALPPGESVENGMFVRRFEVGRRDAGPL